MTAPAPKPPPADSISKADFYAEDERRQTSRVLSYGSGWKDPSWTDANHVIEVMWFGATHEIVAYFITYDWDRLAPGRLSRDAAVGGSIDILADSGVGVGRMLGDVDLATSDVHVLVLGVLGSDLDCHELLWDWRWVQHHPDGFAHIVAKVEARSDAPSD